MSFVARDLARHLLDRSVENLKIDLEPIEQRMIDAQQGMFISHDSASKIIVYVGPLFKAYVPKIYDSWKVDIIEWNGQELELDIDTAIKT